jgi:hypothetical protein
VDGETGRAREAVRILTLRDNAAGQNVPVRPEPPDGQAESVPYAQAAAPGQHAGFVLE